MSVIATNKTNSTTDREPSEFDGLWLNVGVNVKDPETGEAKFIRLSQGIPVAALQIKKVYEKMAPEFAASVQLENQMVREIQDAARQLEDGEAKNTDALCVQLYRKQEEVQTSGNPEPIGIFS